MDHILLVEQSGGTITDGMEQVGTGPVEDGHEVVADDLDAVLGQVADTDLVILNEGIPGGQADLDVVVNVHGLHNLGIEAVAVDQVNFLLDFFLGPDLAGHLAVQGPDDAGHAGNLLDVAEADGVIALAVPAPSHFHRHMENLRFL